MAHDVFVSYSVQDKTVADAVCARLEARALRCWIAPRDILPGMDWGTAIIEAIDHAKVMVLVFSAHANRSPQVRREVQNAVEAGLAILPFRIQDVAPTKSMRYFLGTQHWLDALTPPLDAHLQRLAETVSVLLSKTGEDSAARKSSAPEAVSQSGPLSAAPPQAEPIAAPAQNAPPETDAPPEVPAPVPPSDRQVEEARRAAVDATIEIALGHGVTMSLNFIPAGEFMMGSPIDEEGRQEEEDPQHRVRITQPFYMAVHQVTQAQYQEIMGTNPSKFKGKTNPMENIPCKAAIEFCKRLSAKTGRAFSLPTEAQWEYACRAGSSTAFYFGDMDCSVDGAGLIYDEHLESHAWYHHNSADTTHPVGLKSPNPWGLYDMCGNVWEWCLDWYREDYYQQSPMDDPPGPDAYYMITTRVTRGGCWGGNPANCRSAVRDRDVPEYRRNYLGFRVLTSLAP